MQLENSNKTYCNNNETFTNPAENPIQPRKQTVIYINSQVHTENEATGVIQPPYLEDFDDIIICPALTTTPD